MPETYQSVILMARCPSCCHTNSIGALNTPTHTQLFYSSIDFVLLLSHTHTIILLLFWNLSGTTRVSRYQKGKTRKGKTNLDLLEQEIVSDSGMCWAICKSAPHTRQPRQHPTTQFFTGWMPFLPPNQQCQSAEGILTISDISLLVSNVTNRHPIWFWSPELHQHLRLYSTCHLNNKTYPDLHWHQYLHLCILYQLLDSSGVARVWR